MKIQILGTGCLKCKRLADNAEVAAKELGLDYQIEKLTSIDDIVSYGAVMTPALAVDGQVKVAGKVLNIGDIKDLLSTDN